MRTQLYDWHKKNGDMISFADFDMPVMYSSIKQEHLIVRNAVGLFDVSHMGRMWIEGSDAEAFLNYLTPRDLSKTQVGRASYSFMLNEAAGFRDDLVFERFDKDKWLLVWNAGNLEKIRLWMYTLQDAINQFKQLDLKLTDISATSAMFALQGPEAPKLLSTLIDGSPPSPWSIVNSTIEGIDVLISGTGYTGEKGYEIIILDTTITEPSNALNVWQALLDKEKTSVSSLPCGLGARDSLRLEAGYCLYGNDIDETINPVEADLFFPPFLHMEGPEFIGKSQLKIIAENPPFYTRIGFIATQRGPSPRKGQRILKNGKEIGRVSSGGFSPLLNIGIGMGYVDRNHKSAETLIQFEVRNKLHEAKITPFPMYNADEYGSKRKSSG